LTHKVIWLSSLISSNDALEGKWMTEVIRLVAAEEDLSDIAQIGLLEKARLIDGLTDCLGFCLSTEGDALSQWRGYADDGRGVSIGFNEQFLELAAKPDTLVTFQKVEYDLSNQKQVVRLLFPRIKDLVEKGAFRRPTFGSILALKPDSQYQAELAAYADLDSKLFNILLELHRIWFSFKNPAFREENEWRLAATIISPHETDYRTSGGRLVPYEPLNFPDPQGHPILDEVVLGPKHPTPPNIVENFLRRQGFGEVKVRPSEASYR
jgi:hypothetical protein